MKKATRMAALMALASGAAAPFASAGDIGIGVTITGEITPGVYGRVDLTNRPPPRLVYAEPVYIERSPTVVVVQPVYMHVPPGHAKNWRRYCREYHACNRPVYFVRSAEYEPGYGREKRKKHKHHDDD